MLAKKLCLLVLLLGAPPALAADNQAGPYLFDLMKQPSYRAAWTSMLAGETVPDWVETYAKTLDGPAIPSIILQVDGKAHLLGFVCKAHECGENQLYVLFAPDGARAWGLLLMGGKERKWLGAPDESVQTAILSGVE